MNQALDSLKLGIVSISDRAAAGSYEDKGLPALREWLSRAVRNPMEFEERSSLTIRAASAAR